jgi:histidinol-phosphate/aromatic aminotransferase/cobyric acid decarboxylase-like protein
VAVTASLDPTSHGDVAPAQLLELGLDPSQVIDFAVNINPLGYGPAVAHALATADALAYPERHSETLTRALAAKAGVASESVLVGNGATCLIWSWLRTFSQPGDILHVLEPTFSEARNAANRHALRVTDSWASAAEGFVWNWVQVAKDVQALRPRLLYLCHPNNPTGLPTGRAAISELARANPHTWVMLDESFLSLSQFHEELHAPIPEENVFRLRSLTKDHGIAGVRLGYLLGSAEHLRQLKEQQPPWTVNAYAQRAGLASLSDEAHVTSSRDALLGLRAELSAGLGRLGIACVQSSTLFVMANVRRATFVTKACLARGILVRDCSSFGLPEYIRLCARPSVEQARLLKVLSEL